MKQRIYFLIIPPVLRAVRYVIRRPLFDGVPFDRLKTTPDGTLFYAGMSFFYQYLIPKGITENQS